MKFALFIGYAKVKILMDMVETRKKGQIVSFSQSSRLDLPRGGVFLV